MKIAYLNPLSPEDSFNYNKLTELARAQSIEIEVVRQESHSEQSLREAWKRVRELIDTSDAFFLANTPVIRVNEFVEAIHKRIAGGTRLLIRLDENDIDAQNSFLARYDLSSTRVRVRSRFTPTIEFSRSADCFRDFRLFANVDKVTAQQPNAIWYGGESLPILVGADEGLTSDGRTDFPADWNLREIASFAGWQQENGGSVMAIAGNYFSDPYLGATGVEWPGIDANEQLANNILRYLSEGTPVDSPYGLISRIEVNFGDYVLSKLESNSSDWWKELVPEKIREKCKLRSASEAKGAPVIAYLDLIDLKILVEKNWKYFEEDFLVDGGVQSKKKAVSWLNRLNELRKYVAHSLKQHFANFEFSSGDFEFLNWCDCHSKELLKNKGSR